MSTLLGTDYIRSLSPSSSTSSTTPSTSSSTTSLPPLTPSICQNLSAFKSHLKLSRSLDDSIILRFNRNEALSRSNSSSSSTTSSNSKSNCDKFWLELNSIWNERNKGLQFCENLLDQVTIKEKAVTGGMGEEIGLDRNRSVMGRGESESVVKRRAIRREIQVENIIRTRSIYLFQSKCPEHNLLPKPDELPVFIEDSGEGGNGSKGNRSGRDGKGGVRWNG